MPIRDDPRAFLLAAVAPLTEALAFHLAGSYIKDVSRPIGRPSKAAGDVAARKEQRLRSALELILPSIAMEQEKVYALLDPIVRAGNLTKKWLLNELESYVPDEGIVYPERLREWHRANMLLYTEQQQPEAQSTAALLLMRRLDRRKQRGWLPRRLPAPQSYVCWRLNTRHLPLIPYELPLVALNPEYPTALKPAPTVEEVPYVLYTSWKGARWDDMDAWLLTGRGVIRWVGEPTMEQLTLWLSPQEMASLLDSNSQGNFDLAKQALHILAANRPSYS